MFSSSQEGRYIVDESFTLWRQNLNILISIGEKSILENIFLVSMKTCSKYSIEVLHSTSDKVNPHYEVLCSQRYGH